MRTHANRKLEKSTGTAHHQAAGSYVLPLDCDYDRCILSVVMTVMGKGRQRTQHTHRWTPSYYKKLKEDEGQITEVFFLRIYLESMRPVLPGSLCLFVVQTEGRGRDRLQERQRVKRGRAGREVGHCKCDARQSQIDDPLTCLRADILERVKVPPS